VTLHQQHTALSTFLNVECRWREVVIGRTMWAMYQLASAVFVAFAIAWMWLLFLDWLWSRWNPRKSRY
jgi:hypothetical protein